MELVEHIKQEINSEYEERNDQPFYRMLMQKYGLIATQLTNEDKQLLLKYGEA